MAEAQSKSSGDVSRLGAVGRPQVTTVAIALYTLLSLGTVLVLFLLGRWTALPIWALTVVLAFLWRAQPRRAAILIIIASVVLRLHTIGFGFADQITVSLSAFDYVLAGGNPYGVGYETTVPPGAPFPYGPLGLVWWLPGPTVEFAAVVATMALLWWRGSWLTFAFVAGWHQSVVLTFVGINDYSPGLLIALAVVLLPKRAALAGATLAVAAALKPYAAAWFLPFVGVGGAATAAAIVGVSLTLWSPVLFVWGIPSFLRSLELAVLVHAEESANAFDIPVLRWIAVPMAAAGMFVRRWEFAVLLGAAVFVAFLFTQHWASYGYWMALAPAVGLAVESLWRDRASLRTFAARQQAAA